MFSDVFFTLILAQLKKCMCIIYFCVSGTYIHTYAKFVQERSFIIAFIVSTDGCFLLLLPEEAGAGALCRCPFRVSAHLAAC